MGKAHALYREWLPDMWNAAPSDMPELAERIFSPGAVAHWPNQHVAGPAEIAAKVRESRSMFDDVVVTLEHGPIVDGNLVAARWSFGGRVRDIAEIPAEPGTPVLFHGMDLLRLESGWFAEYWPFGDNAELMRQLGVSD